MIRSIDREVIEDDCREWFGRFIFDLDNRLATRATATVSDHSRFDLSSGELPATVSSSSSNPSTSSGTSLIGYSVWVVMVYIGISLEVNSE